jgi:hypothetical protein
MCPSHNVDRYRLVLRLYPETSGLSNSLLAVTHIYMVSFTTSMAGYSFSSHNYNRPGKLPKGYHQKLTALKKLSQKLNRLIEDGTFYKYPYFQRRKEVQKLTRLYRGLIGRVETGRLQHILAASVVLVGGTSCGLDDIKAGIASRLGNTPPTVTITEGNVELANGAEQIFTAAVTDPDADDTHTYAWYVDSEEQPDAAENTFSFSRAPWEGADYSVQVVVSDGTDTGEDSVTASVERNIVSPSFNAYQISIFELDTLSLFSNTKPTFVDIDGDGDSDLFIGDYNSFEVKYHENDSSSGTARFIPTAAGNIYHSANILAPTFADLDGDGDFDLLIGTENYVDITFVVNDGTSTNPVWTPITGAGSPFYNLFTMFGVYDSIFSPTFVDIDNDGDYDLFMGQRYYFGNPECRIWFFENTGSPTNPAFTSRGYTGYGLTIPVGLYDRPVPFFVDIDNDGDYDCFVSDSQGNIHFWENTGTPENPSFGTRQINPFSLNPGSYYSMAITFVDIDGDGDMDAFAGATDANTRILFFENTSAP